MSDHQRTDQRLIELALENARDTRRVLLGHGVVGETGRLAAELFGGAACVIVADENTFPAAGRQVFDALGQAGLTRHEPMVLPNEGLYAEYSQVDRIRERLENTDGMPIAVGSGTINDLVKLAAHQTNRRCLTVATAASMDGYTAFGSSITRHGSKQTFDCPAPLGVVADLDILLSAPAGMNEAGYADLLAKVPAGADWLLADSLEVDSIDQDVWQLVQPRLRHWLENPAGIVGRDAESVRRLVVALLMTGFAMQTSQSSRPASGAEHQFSHLWDMEGHTYNGQSVSHGFKVGIGTVASLALYESALVTDLGALDIERAVDAWPDAANNRLEIDRLFPGDELAAKAHEESGAKHISADALRVTLGLLAERWTAIRRRLREQVITTNEAADRLRAAGCPAECQHIGITRDRLRISHHKAYHIRRRFTILDLMRQTNLLSGLVGAAIEHPSTQQD
jgi:glycerol-1-phosphate dehydrogenase [NAD(P)+]